MVHIRHTAVSAILMAYIICVPILMFIIIFRSETAELSD